MVQIITNCKPSLESKCNIWSEGEGNLNVMYALTHRSHVAVLYCKRCVCLRDKGICVCTFYTERAGGEVLIRSHLCPFFCC